VPLSELCSCVQVLVMTRISKDSPMRQWNPCNAYKAQNAVVVLILYHHHHRFTSQLTTIVPSTSHATAPDHISIFLHHLFGKECHNIMPKITLKKINVILTAPDHISIFLHHLFIWAGGAGGLPIMGWRAANNGLAGRQ
jgi:hypothetical protein